MVATLTRRSRTRAQSLSRIVGTQTFGCWMGSPPPASTSPATDSFATTKNLYNITRNVTFVAIIARG